MKPTIKYCGISLLIAISACVSDQARIENDKKQLAQINADLAACQTAAKADHHPSYVKLTECQNPILIRKAEFSGTSQSIAEEVNMARLEIAKRIDNKQETPEEGDQQLSDITDKIIQMKRQDEEESRLRRQQELALFGAAMQGMSQSLSQSQQQIENAANNGMMQTKMNGPVTCNSISSGGSINTTCY